MPVKRQHVISQAILRRWTVDGLLAAVDLRTGNVKPKSTKATGFVPWFVRAEYSTPIEAVWKETEDHIPALVAAVEDGSALDSEWAADMLRQLVTVHIVRSKQLAEMWERSYTKQSARGRLASVRSALADPDVARALYEHETDIAVVGDVSSTTVVQAYLTRLHSAAGPGGMWFVENALATYSRVLDDLRGKSVQIGHHASGGLVIGDNPAATYDPSRNLYGLLGGANLAQSIIVMPITPWHVVSFGRTGGYLELTDERAHLLNRVQYACSADWIYTVPNSPDLPLIVDAVKAEPHRLAL